MFDGCGCDADFAWLALHGTKDYVTMLKSGVALGLAVICLIVTSGFGEAAEQNGVRSLNPQPIPPGKLKALNPQPIPPGKAHSKHTKKRHH